jgi:hypothetical protein
MNRRCRLGVLALVIASGAAELHAAAENGFSLSVLRDGSGLPEYEGRGNIYVEASKGAPYALRLSNPLPYRVAVALSVDGLNTIDARHTDPWTARKWVIEPYGSTVIEGWQVSGSFARSFYFTGEKSSYGAELGRTADLGVIEAVFFREKAPLMPVPMSEPAPAPPGNAGAERRRDAAAPQAPAKQKVEALSDELAATGMGERRDHAVFEVALDLERIPAARLRVRYEFRPQLAALGILPRLDDRLARRERASGFSEFCPEPR